MPTVKTTGLYTLDEAEDHIADVRGITDLLQENHPLTDSQVPDAAPTDGVQLYSVAGQANYMSTDGNTYNTGRLTLPATGGLNLGTTLATVPGMTCSLAVGTW